ncbi:MAG: YaaL family protein [Clostridiales bacterium]|nr:YaaL family protein [Clostridiales bacterium]
MLLPNAEIKQIIDLIPGFKTKRKTDDYREEICNAITLAHQEWLDAQSFFEIVSDSDLIDHAIHKIDAAKSKYIYLLRLARENGIRVDI